jgi:hypothetical protein
MRPTFAHSTIKVLGIYRLLSGVRKGIHSNDAVSYYQLLNTLPMKITKMIVGLIMILIGILFGVVSSGIPSYALMAIILVIAGVILLV